MTSGAAHDDPQPLRGRHIAITRASAQAPDLAARLEAQGARVTVLSTISIEPAADFAPLDAALDVLDTYDWVLFTSVNGVHAFAQRLWDSDRDWRALHRARVGAIGPATARALESLHLRPDRVPDEYVAEELAMALGNVAGQRILLPRADIAREALAAELRLRGAEVTEVAAYRTVVRPPDPEALRRMVEHDPLDAITFTSSSTVRGFLASLAGSVPGAIAALPHSVVMACIGPITAGTLREAGIEPAVVAHEYTMDGLTRALVAYFADHPASPKDKEPA